MASAVIDTAVAGDRPRGSVAPELERREILRALRLLRRGDFSVRLPLDLAGIDGEIACAFNEVVELNDAMTRDFERVSEMVGREGMISERVHMHGATGSWAHCVDSINRLVGDMSYPVSEVARVIGAVARKVGTEGKLGGQAHVRDVAGIWKDLTDSVNHMAANLTGQVRNIAEVSTAIARGNLSKKITVDVKGEILEQHQVHVVNAESGRQGIEQLESTDNVDMVLMDVMMPDMDGYETMRQIRRIERFRKLPIIAITAKG
ncbi:MAG: response regulator, partial [Steroidobacteraceae bacterium]